jgi:hypothetical protein
MHLKDPLGSLENSSGIGHRLPILARVGILTREIASMNTYPQQI